MMAAAIGARFPILADVEHQVAEIYGVFNRLGDGLAAPSVFIVDENGRIVWHHIGAHPNDRLSAAEIFQHIP